MRVGGYLRFREIYKESEEGQKTPALRAPKISIKRAYNR